MRAAVSYVLPLAIVLAASVQYATSKPGAAIVLGFAVCALLLYILTR
jgi:hypothetical protein